MIGKHYRSQWEWRDECGMDRVTFIPQAKAPSPIGPSDIRVWNEHDMQEIVDGLDAAFEAGMQAARDEMLTAMGIGTENVYVAKGR